MKEGRGNKTKRLFQTRTLSRQPPLLLVDSLAMQSASQARGSVSFCAALTADWFTDSLTDR